MTASRPPDFVLVLAAWSYRWEWVSAAEITEALPRFGYEASVQQVAPYLGRMAREGSPAFERWDRVSCSYRVTSCGETWVRNALPGLWRVAVRHASEVDLGGRRP
jgi:hypothetical protein